MIAPYRIELLNDSHQRATFDCGQSSLNDYLKTRASQDARRRVATYFVAIDRAMEAVAAYYTLSAAAIPIPDLPLEIQKKLPRYPTIPAARMARLAVDRRYQGQGLGAALLADALARILESPLATFALIVDAKDEEAAQFYLHHGFQRFSDTPLQLFLLLATAASARAAARTGKADTKKANP
ncbi:MAG: GNAT family N-acetyltransferase [Bryobacter sp.]|nr:GNAT family N-acetyltransferase [Bryobacter sp.]